MKVYARHRIFRWSVILSTLFVILSQFYPVLTGGPSVTEVSKNYTVYGMPGGYSVFMWTIIYLSFIVYGIIQLLPGQRNYSIYDQLAVPTAVLHTLTGLWIILFTGNNPGAALLVIGLMLVLACALFLKAHQAVARFNYNLWLQLPYCSIAAWLFPVAAINFFVWIGVTGWSPAMGVDMLVLLGVLATGIIGYLVSVRTSSLVFPAVLSWGMLGLSYGCGHTVPFISKAALTCACLLLVVPTAIAVFKNTTARKRI